MCTTVGNNMCVSQMEKHRQDTELNYTVDDDDSHLDINTDLHQLEGK